MKTAFLFSGQGSQSIGMGKTLYENFSCCKDIFDKADCLLDYKITEMCFSDNEELNRTRYTQPTVFTLSMAAFELMKQEGVKADYMAGFSLGEYAALTASGAIGFEECIQLLDKRGLFMEEAAEKNPGGMSALLGLTKEQAQLACDAASKDGYVVCANYNTSTQIVISGEIKAIEAAEKEAKALGGKAVRVKVGGAFHCAMMDGACVKLAGELEKITFKKSEPPVITSVTGNFIENSEDISNILEDQIRCPVRWEDTIIKLSSLGVDTFVELGPGKALSGFVKRILKDVNILNVCDCESFDKTMLFFRGKQ